MKTHASTNRQGTTPARNPGAARPAFFSPAAEPATAFFSTTSGPLQTALTVSQPGEPHEIEAEAMADRVVSHQDAPFFSRAAGVQRQAAEQPPGPADLERAVEAETEDKEEIGEMVSPAHGPALSRSPAAPMQRATSRRPQGDGRRPHPPRTISPTLSRAALPARSVGGAARIDPSRARGPPSVGSRFESRLRGSKGGGQPLSAGTRMEMESSFGADFSGVRIHAGSEADQLSRSIHARAFTHGQDIYFSQNRYQPEDRAGRHLLAHELTHVIQQGGGIRETGPVHRSADLSRVPPQLQRIPTSMEELRGEINGLAEAIPGYALGTVLIGYNPILGQNVTWSAPAFFRGAAGLIPGGVAVYDKLNEGGAINGAFAWIEGQIAARNLTWGRVSGLWDVAWERMGVTEGISGNLEIFRGTFSGFFADVLGFIGAVIDRLTSILKDLAIAAVRALFGSDGPAYDMITMVLGEDPLTGEARTWETVEFLRAALRFFGFGNHIAKMDETGQLQNAADWLDQQFGLLSSALSGLVSGITGIWDSLGLETLANPLDVLTRTVGVVSGFVGSLLEFVGNLAAKILELIKEIVISLAKAHVHRIPGYRLFTVIIGLDPVSGEGVPRTAMNFVHGFLDFVPDGEAIYQNLAEGNAIGQAMDWLAEQADQLGLTPDAIVQRFTDLWLSFSIDDLMDPIGAFEQVAGVFLGFIGDVLTLAGRIALKLLEILFEVVMGSGGARVLAILKQAQGTFNTIVEDPVAFVGNLVNAAKQGFTQFGANILDHLIDGLTGWLFGALEGAGIQVPQQFDLQGILSLVLQVLGLTYAQIRPQLVEQLGEPTVGHLETAFEVVRILVTEGLAGIWERLTEFITVSLPDMIIGGIRNFVMTTIVQSAITRIATMLNPAGAVVQAIIAIYNTVMFFIERMDQIITTVEAYVNSISRIASGDIGDAANAVEAAMASTLPVIISFLARLIGLGGISDRIREIIQRIQAPIQAAIGRVIAWVVGQARRLGNALFGGGNPENSPETPQSEEVKRDAQTLLQARLQSEDEQADIESAVRDVGNQLRPRGLQQLGIRYDTEGTAHIFAVASPPRDLFSLVKKSLGEGSENATVRTQATVTLNPPAGPRTDLDQAQVIPQPGTSAGRTLDRNLPGVESSGGVPGANVATSRRSGDRNGNRTGLDSVRIEPVLPPEHRARGGTRGGAGGALFIEASRNVIRTVTWNTTSTTDSGSASHAETQFVNWFGQQDRDWIQRVTKIQLANNPMSPCDGCSGQLAGFIDNVNSGRSTPVESEISWTSVHSGTTAGGLGALAGKWRMFGPRPQGVRSRHTEGLPSDRPGSGGLRADEANLPANSTAADLDLYEISPIAFRTVQRKPKHGGETDGLEREANQHARRFTGSAHARSAAPDPSLQAYADYFGADFSAVRLHHDLRSAALCEACDARAFTRGHDIHFNRGEYDPASRKGQDLLAHELSHVVQQGAAPPLAGSLHPTPTPEVPMKIRPTFRRSARRVSRRASEAPFFQNETSEPPFFSPATDARAKAPEPEAWIATMPEEEVPAKQPEDEMRAKQTDEEVQAKQEDEQPVMAKCGCGCGGGGACRSAEVPEDARAKRPAEGAAIAASPVKDQTCSGGKLAVISLARSRAKLLADRAVAGLTSLLLLEDAPGNPPAAFAHFERWFGGYEAGRVRLVRNQFLKIAAALAGTVEFDCDCDRAIYAFASPGGKRRITLCRLFWSAGASGYDSKAGVILHELAHDVCFALDLRYGMAKAEALAATTPLLATLNADNYEYFAESL